MVLRYAHIDTLVLWNAVLSEVVYFNFLYFWVSMRNLSSFNFEGKRNGFLAGIKGCDAWTIKGKIGG